MNEELRAHLDALTERNIAAGMPPDEARFAALRAFGGVEQIKESARDERRSAWVESWLQDLRYAVRQVRKSPGFAAIIVMTLALGIGANTAIFSVVHALMLRPLPVPEPEQLAIVHGAETYARFDRLRGEVQTLAGVLAVGHIRQHRLAAPALGLREIESVNVQEVTGNFFAVLEQPALLGRTLVPDDDRAGAPRPVVVLSHAYWLRRFKGDPAVLGQSLTINGIAVAIVGVMPPEFFGVDVSHGRIVELWCPLWLKTQLSAGSDAQRLTTGAIGSSWLKVMGRLRPGATLETTRAELAAISDRDRAQASSDHRPPRLRVQPGATGYSWMRGQYRQPLNVLWAIAAGVLIVALANVGGLLLARGATREREFAVRLAMGAGRARLLRQLITESLLLAVLGGAAGLLVARWGMDALGHYLGSSDLGLGLDPIVLAFALVVAVGGGFAFGLAPALRFSRLDLTAAFQAGGKGIVRGRPWLHGALVVLQLALAFVLLAGAALFARTLQKLRTFDPGFARERVWQFTLDLGREPTLAQRDEMHRRLLDGLEALPGVQGATISHGGMLGGFNSWTRFTLEGGPPTSVAAAGGPGPGAPGQTAADFSAAILRIGRRYFETKGIALRRGEDFSARHEQSDAPRAAIVSEQFVTRYFPDRDPIGQRIRFNAQDVYEIAGIARDAQVRPVRDPQRDPVIYLPFFQHPNRGSAPAEFTVRAADGHGLRAADVRALVRRIAPAAQVAQLSTVTGLIEQQFDRERAVAELAGFFSGLTLVLAGLGLYGMQAFNVTQRTREIGVRIALGAQLRDVLRLIVGQGLRHAVIGCALGLGGAFALTRLVAGLLFGVPPIDPWGLGAAALLMLLTALLACALPARRAAKVDPMAALRAE